MKEAEDEISKLNKEFEEFAYIVSHDLKAPLRGIVNLSEWIEEDFGPNVDEDIKDNFELLKQRVAKMSDMLEALTKYSRVTRRGLDLAEVDLNNLLVEIKDDIEHRYPNVEVIISGSCGKFQTFAKKIYQVVEEVVENAAKHNANSDNLIINLSLKDSYDNVEINVSDSGKGVPAELIPDLTKLFYTLEPKDKSKTVGAGLAIVKKTIDLVQGKLKINTLNKGLSISIIWPKNTINHVN